MRLVAFCEAPADFRLAAALVDRVLRAQAPWIADVLDVAPDGIRSWVGDGEGLEFFDLHRVKAYALRCLARVPQGHFDGRSGSAGAVMARSVFRIVRELNRQPGEPIDGVVLVWDMDGQADDRRRGLEQARTEAEQLVQFQIVLGRADRMREAWVLAGFEPASPAEHDRLRDERQELGFDPSAEPHLLTASDRMSKRSAKRVLAVLTGGDPDREARCWADTALATLRERGAASGLTELLAEIEQRLVPLCSPAVP